MVSWSHPPLGNFVGLRNGSTSISSAEISMPCEIISSIRHVAGWLLPTAPKRPRLAPIQVRAILQRKYLGAHSVHLLRIELRHLDQLQRFFGRVIARPANGYITYAGSIVFQLQRTFGQFRFGPFFNDEHVLEGTRRHRHLLTHFPHLKSIVPFVHPEG